jgi:hypothetical protein
MERRNSSLSFSLSPAVLALSFLPLSQSDNQMTERVLVVVVGLAHSPDPPPLSILYTPRFYINRSWEEGGCGGFVSLFSLTLPLSLVSLPMSRFRLSSDVFHHRFRPKSTSSLSLCLSLSCFAFSYSMFNFFTLGGLKGQVISCVRNVYVNQNAPLYSCRVGLMMKSPPFYGHLINDLEQNVLFLGGGWNVYNFPGRKKFVQTKRRKKTKNKKNIMD